MARWPRRISPLRWAYRWLFGEIELPLAEGEWKLSLSGPRSATGERVEQMVAGYLRRKGHRILCRNRANSFGELDLVTRVDGMLVFVEVRSRTTGSPVSAAKSLTKRKRAAWRGAADEFLRKHRLRGRRYRFDLVAVETSPDGSFVSLRHIENLQP
jgi:putative endonuclease